MRTSMAQAMIQSFNQIGWIFLSLLGRLIFTNASVRSQQYKTALQIQLSRRVGRHMNHRV
tara:strand:- start:1391 stop:1570 length:180 start_codon:yes stop_codon:yes gene_type:complete